MRNVWILAGGAVVGLGAGAIFLAERPLTVTVVQPETEVALRIYGLGTVEARVLARVGFEVGGALTSLAVDAGDLVSLGQELAELQSAVSESLRRFEFDLRRKVEGEADDVRLTGSDDVPAEFKSLVEEYYRSLAKPKAPQK